ncbi:MAG: TldD/PmbA family protein [candidate division WOR-3 bacterium]|nr:MAG: TldD/PmbA family protein [candidate division WOR-3 bacterium]
MMEQYQIIRIKTHEGLTRFANSTIHQNVVKDETESAVLYVVDKKKAVLDSTGTEPDLKVAREIALNSEVNPDFVSLPDADEAGQPEFKGSFSKDAAQASPEVRARLVKEILALCTDKGLQAAGYLTTGSRERNIENSLGVKREDRTSFSELGITATGAGTGYATATHYDLDHIDVKEIAREAVETALQNVNQDTIEPGKYRVLLEPLAVHELFDFMAWLGFSGRLYDENQSCFSGMLNKEITSPLLTFTDEPIQELPGFGIDIEGVARRRTLLVEKGIFKNVTYDSYSAHMVNKKSTGNAFSFVVPWGGLPLSINVAAGKTDIADMLHEIKKGLLIKRFWYTRPVDRKSGILTGMTRDGTFLVTDGKIDRPVKNLRFQISLPEILKKIRMVGNTLRLYESGRFPHLLVDDFAITGMTG